MVRSRTSASKSKYTGTVVFGCSSADDKDYKLQLVREANSVSSVVNIDMPGFSIGHEVDVDVSLMGSYHACRGQRSLLVRIFFDSAAFHAKSNGVPPSPAITADILMVSVRLI